MKELLRVFGRNTILLLLTLCFVNTGIFILCADPEKEITLAGEVLDIYLEDYPSFLDRTVSNSRTMARLGMYQSGFAKENLVKVTESYSRLQDIQVKAGDNRGLILYMKYDLTDIFLIVFLFSVVMRFFTERKKGLVYIVRSTKYGRGALFLQRLIILALATILGMAILHGGTFLGTCLTFGIDDLDRSIQSLPEFIKCPFPITIGEYLLYSCALKAVGSLLAGVLLYVVLGVFSSFTAYVFLGVTILAEIVSAVFITPISSLNMLRYVNMITLIQADSYFDGCVYLDVFGEAVPALQMALITAGTLLAALAITGFFVHGRMYVTKRAVAEKIAEWFRKTVERFALQRTLMGWEIYKLCIKQGGLFLLIGLTIVQISLSFQYDYYYPVPTFEQLSYLKYQGDLTEETLSNADNEMRLLRDAEKRLRDAIQEVETTTPFNTRRYNDLTIALTSNLAQQDGLRPVIEDIRDGMAYTEKTGNSICIVAPYTYDLLINRDTQTKRRAAFLEIMVIIGSIAGIYAYEKQNHMSRIIHSSYRGRWVNTVGKPIMVCAFCGVTGMCMHVVQIVHVGLFMDLNDLNVPVQSLKFMREFPIYTSIAGYFVMLLFLRILMAAVFGLLMAVISNLCADKFTAIGQGILLCMLGMSLSGLIPTLDFTNPIFLLCADFFR